MAGVEEEEAEVEVVVEDWENVGGRRVREEKRRRRRGSGERSILERWKGRGREREEEEDIDRALVSLCVGFVMRGEWFVTLLFLGGVEFHFRMLSFLEEDWVGGGVRVNTNCKN